MEKRYKVSYIFFIVIGIFLLPNFLWAQDILDSDEDTIPDEVEVSMYGTDPKNKDTDGDGYNDFEEISQSFSPHEKNKNLRQTDFDKDGLNDFMELLNHFSMISADTDKDGFSDGDEMKNGYDPRKVGGEKLEKKIIVDTNVQQLTYYLGDIEIDTYLVSTGVPWRKSPKGEFTIHQKIPKAWSRTAKVWMPLWMAYVPTGKYGFHAIPERTDGSRYGRDVLGEPASGGCIRLGDEEAKILYNWAEVGTKVMIHGER